MKLTEWRRSRGLGSSPALAVALLLAAPASALGAGEVTEFPIPTAGSQPYAIIAGADGNLWFTENAKSTIGRITPTGAIREFNYRSGTPAGLAVAQDGNVWFGDRLGRRVGRIKPLGAIRFFATPTTSSFPDGVAAAPNGNLWIAEGIAKIGQVGPGGFGGNPPVVTELNGPAGNTDIAAGIDGNLWFTNFTSPAKIVRITPGGTVSEFTVGLTPNSQPLRIAAGHDGNLWFTEQAGNRIGRITPTGVITEFGLPLGVTGPVGIAAGPDGNMWFAAIRDIGRITPAGLITVYSDGITAGARPYGIGAGPDGYMWFTEYGGNRIGRIATGIVLPTTGNLLLNPGFEQGTRVSSNVVSGPIPGWTTVPSFSAALYGAAGLADATVGTQVGGGTGFGWGGTMSANIDRSWALQHVDVAREAPAIDDGRATITLSGLLGGLAAQEDNANVRALFLSGSGDELGSAQIGPVTRADRQNQTTLLPRSASAALPAGTRAIRVVATSIRVMGGATNDGFFDNLSLTLAIAPPPAQPAPPPPPVAPPPPPVAPPPPPPGPAAIADTTAPAVTRLTAIPARFAVGPASTAISARSPRTARGTTLTYGLSEAAVVTLDFARAAAGRRAGSRCVTPTSRNRRARRCTRYLAAGRLTRKAPLGLSRLNFSGRIGRKALALGSYRLTALATDAAGNKSKARQLAIKVVRP